MSFSMAAATILATDPTPICTTTEPGLIGTITDWLIMLMETIGGIGVALAIALESIFPPIPSEVILPLSGFTAARAQGQNHAKCQNQCRKLFHHKILLLFFVNGYDRKLQGRRLGILF